MLFVADVFPLKRFESPTVGRTVRILVSQGQVLGLSLGVGSCSDTIKSMKEYHASAFDIRNKMV